MRRSFLAPAALFQLPRIRATDVFLLLAWWRLPSCGLSRVFSLSGGVDSLDDMDNFFFAERYGSDVPLLYFVVLMVDWNLGRIRRIMWRRFLAPAVLLQCLSLPSF